jgi:hypothetical protein
VADWDIMKAIPPFTKKLVMVYTSKSRQPALLEKVKFKTLGDRLFLVGNYPKGYGWIGGTAAGIAWSDVIEYLILENMADYRARNTPENPLGA